MLSGDYDKMGVAANTMAEPTQPPTVAHVADDPRIIDEGNFWTRLKKKLFNKK